MGVPVIVFGRSGSGKSTSIRAMEPGTFGLINVLGKPLPFRGSVPQVCTTDYGEVQDVLAKSASDTIVIDDAGYLITEMFMSRHSDYGSGNSTYALYNDIGDSFYKLIRFISRELPPERIVVIMMHEDVDAFGNTKIKTIGKLLDDKVCIEGMLSVVLRAVSRDGRHFFATNNDGIAKSPDGMFEADEVPNDLALVISAIRDYWDLRTNGGDAQ